MDRVIQCATFWETEAQGGRALHRLMGIRHCGAHSFIRKLVEVLTRPAGATRHVPTSQ